MLLKTKNVIIVLIFCLFIFLSFRSKVINSATKYKDNIYQVKTINNIEYGQAKGYTGKTEKLYLDLFQPIDNSNDLRPLIIFVHGGSFVGGDKNVYTTNAVELAKKGYVVTSINYRLDTTRVNNPYNAQSPDLDKPIGTSREDTLMALRFLLSKSKEYRINKNIIFLGGSSAGALTALYTSFSEEIDAKKIKAVYSIAGTVIDKDFEIIDANDPPAILFNGTTDGIIPYDMAKATVNKLKSVNVKAILVTYTGKGHEIISRENVDIHNKLINFLYPYTIANIPSTTITITLTPTITIGPTINLTLTPTPTLTSIKVEELITYYLSAEKKADLNNDGVVNGYDYFVLYEKNNH